MASERRKALRLEAQARELDLDSHFTEALLVYLASAHEYRRRMDFDGAERCVRSAASTLDRLGDRLLLQGERARQRRRLHG